ncbi:MULTISPECIES: hypothetical protein [unclassified Sporosarcina]|uniref:hypothetical protein n=1 Tax=unclassified Sporosarcina TaxID=2647733 RepID=UPI000C16553D|nr:MULTISPECIES: hypothetical protein [unclassified Sporosarcina]PID01940.1 hypothetical protein CSV67_11365 [Sporosarcina sp. P2]PID24307.1 hypothetical protein CSV60_10095 [Sporosarcina sp. P7]
MPTMDTEELLLFAKEADESGTTWIQQADYEAEEAIMTDEDLAGKEPLQRLRIVVESDGNTKYFETLFYTGAELEELMSELEPVFKKYPKKVLDSDEMDEKIQGLKK